ncbi:MAG: hypothetical protein KDK24_10580 [Pseudooceanicola sp.]|nr:hypothetical protein [Pseudooceanicola sp.]
MYGVVLWSDKLDRKAVIWCEDHGDLALCRQDDTQLGVSLDAGDWIEFDLETARHQRVACNPRLVAEGVYTTLPETLSSAANAPRQPSRRARNSVLSFPARESLSRDERTGISEEPAPV